VSEYEYKRKTVTDFVHDFGCFNLWVEVLKEGGFDVDDIIQYRPKRTVVPQQKALNVSVAYQGYNVALSEATRWRTRRCERRKRCRNRW
jgi:hypothetical protein